MRRAGGASAKALAWVSPLLLLAGCLDVQEHPDPGTLVGHIPAEPQRMGDPQAGYRALINNGYIGCGIPYSAVSPLFGSVSPQLKLPGREGNNASLPYYLTSFPASSGIEVVAPNCLSCHATRLFGKIVVGVGDTTRDFTVDQSDAASLAGLLVRGDAERAEWQKFVDRMQAVGPYTITRTIGTNPADNLAAVLFSHRNPETLEWSKEPLLELPPPLVVPVDVPPWWHMKKKNAMFYNAAGRGDQARIMMTASTLCTDSVAEAEAIDSFFGDIRAYIASIEPPAYPLPVDLARAAKGRPLFEDHCSRCHGTYGSGGSYPNLLIAIDEIGTDSILADSSQFAGRFVDWFDRSFYGRTARLEPGAGYVAPPLDGIWATAPYLHNGSVPTLAALLDSSSRPKYWTRTSEPNDYDDVAVGWHTITLEQGQDAVMDAAAKVKIYDTTLPGHSNGGHIFADRLTSDERSALIEYLKTL